MDNSPVALELPCTKRKRDERLVLYFTSRDPRRENSRTQAAFHHFFDGIHTAQFDHQVQDNFFPEKVILNQAEGVTIAFIEDPALLGNLRRDRLFRLGPGMAGGNEKREFVSEKRMKFQLAFVFWLDGDRQIHFARPNKFNRIECVGRFDDEMAVGIVSIKLRQYVGQNVFAERGAGGDAEPVNPPFPEMFQRRAGVRHLPKYALGVVQ